jgi:phage terminase large subunit GpA-like protein
LKTKRRFRFSSVDQKPPLRRKRDRETAIPPVSIETTVRTLEMAKCETCGNEYDKAFELTIAGKTHVFDSFECAIQAVAPTCEHCGCRILGHGVEKDDAMYCCAHCAAKAGATGLADRA